MKKQTPKKRPAKKQPPKETMGPGKAGWKKLVDATFSAIKVSYQTIPPVPKGVKKGSAQYSRLLASNVVPFDFCFQIRLPETGGREIDTAALVKALWARLFGTEKGRGMLRDAVCGFLRKGGGKALIGSDISFGKYSDVKDYDDLLFWSKDGSGFTFWEEPRKGRAERGKDNGRNELGRMG